MTDADSGFVGTVRRNEDLPSEINKQLARRKVTFRNKFTLGVLWHPLHLSTEPSLSLFSHIVLQPFSYSGLNEQTETSGLISLFC